MSDKQFAKNLLDTVQELKDKGTDSIDSENLIQYLQNIVDSPTENLSKSELEQQNINFQLFLATRKNVHEMNVEMLKSVLQSGQNALRSSFLLNGGSAVALLAFIGKLTDSNKDKIQDFSGSLIIFVAGVLVITIAYGFTYLTQWFYQRETKWNNRFGLLSNVVAISCGLTSYGFFTWGMYRAYCSFINFV